MTRLLHVELRRLGSRRLFRLLLLALFLTVAGVIVVNAALSNRNLAAAQAKAAARAAAFASPPPRMVQACGGKVTVTAPPKVNGGGGTIEVGPCTFFAPTAADFYSDPRFSFAANALNLVITAVALVSVLGFVMGAGFIGAEWTAGTFPLLLTWEPRRLRVLLAKLATVVIAFVAVGVVTIPLILAGGWLIGATRGTTAGFTTVIQHRLLWYSLRGLVLIGLLTGAGAAVAGLTRHTSAALAGAVGYLVIFELVMRRFHPQWARWFLTSNSGALLGGFVHLDVPPVGPVRASRFVPGATFTLHADRAALFLGALFVVTIGAWALALVRRDVDEGAR